jgi:hypothetical protein
MRRILTLAAIAAVALMGTSCTTSGGGDIFPMSIGSVWNHDILIMAGTTTASLDTFETGTATTTALEKANLTSGEEVVKFKNETTIHMRMPDSTYTSTTYSYMREAGDWILSYSDLSGTTPDTVMVTEPALGKTWHQNSGTAEIVGQEDVSVVAGTYKGAWKVKATMTQGGSTFDIYYWYATGTGMVQAHFETSYQGYSQTYDQELTSVTIK